MSTPKTEPNGRIQRRDNAPQRSELEVLLQRMGPEIARALPKHVNPDRMARIALTALRTTPKLMQCTPASFLACIVQAAQLGLEPNTPLGHSYLLPFKLTKGDITVCQLIIGYQGMIDLARRSGMLRSIYAFPVYEGDEFSWTLGLDPTITHRPALERKDRALLTHVYAVAKLAAGDPIFTVLSRREVEAYRDRSMAKNRGPWISDYEAMALKTAIRRLYRWLPKSAEMARAEALDLAPENGRNQLAATDPDVLALLQSQGLDVEQAADDDAEDGAVVNTTAESATNYDPQTGEVRS